MTLYQSLKSLKTISTWDFTDMRMSGIWLQPCRSTSESYKMLSDSNNPWWASCLQLNGPRTPSHCISLPRFHQYGQHEVEQNKAFLFLYLWIKIMIENNSCMFTFNLFLISFILIRKLYREKKLSEWNLEEMTWTLNIVLTYFLM